MPNLDYTGEFNAGFGLGALVEEQRLRVVRLTDASAAPFYEDGAGRFARLRLDAVVRKSSAAGATVEVFVHDSLGVQQGEALLVNGCGASFRNLACDLALPDLAGTAPYYLGVRILADDPGAWDGFFRLVPFGSWGWEGATLCTAGTMRAIEDDLFNEAIYAGGGDYTNELRRAKADVRLRLLEAGIDPDAIWTDGVLAAPGDDSPSGIGTQVIPGLVLAATYAAISNAYGRVAGYTDGRIADKAVQFKSNYDEAMRGAIKSLIPINLDNDSVMSREESRPHRQRRCVL
jgi:hypothetical protein